MTFQRLAPTSKTSGTKFFSTDLYFPSGVINVEFVPRTDCILEYTKDGGSNWYNALSGETVVANKGRAFSLIVSSIDALNFRQSTGTITVEMQIVQSSEDLA